MAIQHDETLQEQLFEALRDANSSTLGTILGTLILTDADINAQDDSGLTPLEAAFAWGCPDEMRIMLIESGADVAPVIDQIGWAARTGSTSVVQKFLDAGADPNGRGTTNQGNGVRDEVSGVFDSMFGNASRGRGAPYANATPLIIAAGEGHDSIIRLLLERGADIAATDGDSRTAFDMAQQRRHTSCVIALLDGGAAPPVGEPTESDLLKAAESGDVAKMREIVRRGADLEERDTRPATRGFTAAMLAAAHGHAKVITVLLGAGADPDASNDHHETALHIAAQGNRRKAAQALIGGGAECEPKNASGETPLMLAVESDAVEMFYDLLAAGADPLAQDAAGKDVASRLGPASAEMRELLQAALPAAPRPRVPKAGAPRKKVARKAKKQTSRKASKKKTSRKKAAKKSATRKSSAKTASRKKPAVKAAKARARKR